MPLLAIKYSAQLTNEKYNYNHTTSEGRLAGPCRGKHVHTYIQLTNEGVPLNLWEAERLVGGGSSSRLSRHSRSYVISGTSVIRHPKSENR